MEQLILDIYITCVSVISFIFVLIRMIFFNLQKVQYTQVDSHKYFRRLQMKIISYRIIVQFFLLLFLFSTPVIYVSTINKDCRIKCHRLFCYLTPHASVQNITCCQVLMSNKSNDKLFISIKTTEQLLVSEHCMYVKCQQTLTRIVRQTVLQ